jgi:hypothetical protein
MQTECSVESCENTAVARGWCPKHWMRWRHLGSPNVVTARDLSPEERFWAKVDRSGSCWLWTAARRGDGYGAFQVESQRQVSAHRYSYEIHHGEIPSGMVVMHSCDRPLCVNPEHLSLGTNAENAADSARKARRPRGSHNSQAKLTEGQVITIRLRYDTGGITQAELAEEYGVSLALVSTILARKAWRHI